MRSLGARVSHRGTILTFARRAALLAGAFGLLMAGPAAAQELRSANLPDVTAQATGPRSISPPVEMAPVPDEPERTGPLQVHVFGDSLGDGIWAGLYRRLPKAEGYEVTKHSRVSTGLVRKDYYDWSKAVRQITANSRVDVAVVMIGTNDRQTIIEGGQRHALRSAEWERIYKARIDDMIRVLKDEGAEIYWVELPAMRSRSFGGDMQYFNSLYRERAAAHGINFIPTWQRTLDENGAYSAYGTDDGGRTRLMRTNDGIHFTMRGYIKLASFVTDVMEGEAAAAPAQPPVAAEPVEPAPGLKPTVDAAPTSDVPTPRERPVGDHSAVAPDDAQGRGEGQGIVSRVASTIKELRGFVLPEPKDGRADDFSLPVP